MAMPEPSVMQDMGDAVQIVHATCRCLIQLLAGVAPGGRCIPASAAQKAMHQLSHDIRNLLAQFSISSALATRHSS